MTNNAFLIRRKEKLVTILDEDYRIYTKYKDILTLNCSKTCLKMVDEWQTV